MIRRLAVIVASLALLTTTLAITPASSQEPQRQVTWRYLLDRATQAAEKRAYTGEVLWITYSDEGPHISTFDVSSTGQGQIDVTDRGRYDVRLSDDGSGLADFERGWYVPLPAADLARAHKGLSRLERKYLVEVVGTDALLDRPVTKIEIRRRSDESLVERLWVDDDSGLLLRREMYDGADTLLRQVAYLRLDLDPVAEADGAQRTPRTRSGTIRRRPRVTEIDDAKRRALQSAGWTVPDALPSGFLAESSFTVSSDETEPLQLVYGDGLYSVSLFEQTGEPDFGTLPDGAVKTEVLGFEAYTWPGAVPPRYVWEASGKTFSLVGDAPPADIAEIAASLPQPERLSFGDRLRRGFSRLWSWVSPWS